jgi:hypothetical protein
MMLPLQRKPCVDFELLLRDPLRNARHHGLELLRQRLDLLVSPLDLVVNRGDLGTRPALTDASARLTRRPTVGPEETRKSSDFRGGDR